MFMWNCEFKRARIIKDCDILEILLCSNDLHSIATRSSNDFGD